MNTIQLANLLRFYVSNERCYNLNILELIYRITKKLAHFTQILEHYLIIIFY